MCIYSKYEEPLRHCSVDTVGQPVPSQLLNPDPGWQGTREALYLVTVCNLESKSSEAAGPALMWKLEMPLTSRWSYLEVPPDAATAKTHGRTHNETHNMITEVLCLFKSRLEASGA